MRFSSPEYLLLLLLCCGLFWRELRTGARLNNSGWRRNASRSAVAVLLILAAAGLEVPGSQAPLSVMFVMDISESMANARAEMRSRIRATLAQFRPGDRAGLIVFGREAVVEQALGSAVNADAPVTAVVSTTDTDIEAALRLARSALPPVGDRHIVLLSDGQETRGDAVREASLAAAEGISIDIAPLQISMRQAAVVSRVSAPPLVSTGETFEVLAIAEGPPAESANVVIAGEKGNPAIHEVRFSSGGIATVAQTFQEPQPGVYVYRAHAPAARPSDLLGPEAEEGTVVVMSGRRRVLHVGTGPGLENILTRAFGVDHVTPMTLPRVASAMASYDAVILHDVRPDILDAQQTAVLAQHVETRGGGLLVLGNAATLDAAIVPGTGIGPLLPIDVRPRAGTRAPELALVVVFDKSGSMDDRVGGQAKIEYARQGVQRVLDALPPTDALGVIAFDAAPTTVAPLAVGHDSRTVNDRLRAISPSGSTAIAPAVQRAVEWLSAPEMARLSRRHILLVTDGRSPASDVTRLRALAAGAGVPMSIISLGDDRDELLLASLAAETGGRAYFPEDARALPALAAREAALVAGGRVVDEPFTPRGSPHPMTNGLTSGTVPMLGGYVVGAARPGAEVPLSSHRLDPILASWRYGLGKVAVYTADLTGPWSTRLRSSDVFEPFVTDLVRWVSRSANDESFFVSIQNRQDHVGLLVETVNLDGSYASLLDLRAAVRRPSGETEHVRLAETTPGRYETAIPASEAGPYIVQIDGRSRDGAFSGQVLRGFYWSPMAERRTRDLNTALLARMRDITNGAVIDGESNALLTRSSALRDMRPWLLSAAFVLFLIELLTPNLRAIFAWRRRAASRVADEAAA